MDFTDDIIEELITCSKQVIDPPSRDFKEENRHKRKDMRLQDINNSDRVFTVFLRQSLEFAEDFSIGLVYLSKDAKRMTLVRFNGQHDQSNDPFDQGKTHFQYHIHRATAANLNSGRYDKHPASQTLLYASFFEATQNFLTTTGVRTEDVNVHFPGMDVLPLWNFGKAP